jgi:hypothetical protein
VFTPQPARVVEAAAAAASSAICLGVRRERG